MSDLFDDADIISVYTNDQAIADGIKVRLGDRLYATTNLMRHLAPEEHSPWNDTGFSLRGCTTVLNPLLGRYNGGDYGGGEQVDREFAVYKAVQPESDHDPLEVWFILDGDGLTMLLPEDY